MNASLTSRRHTSVGQKLRKIANLGVTLVALSASFLACFASAQEIGRPETPTVVATTTTSAASQFDTTKYPQERRNLSQPNIAEAFPRLKEFEVLAPSTRDYNCIAHSLGVHSRWVNPETGPREAPLSRMDRMYEGKGYKRLPSLDLSMRAGKQKVVVYMTVLPDGDWNEVTHAAVQETDGTWTSKCGGLALIRHPTPYSLRGNAYGTPAAVYERDAR